MTVSCVVVGEHCIDVWLGVLESVRDGVEYAVHIIITAGLH